MRQGQGPAAAGGRHSGTDAPQPGGTRPGTGRRSLPAANGIAALPATTRDGAPVVVKRSHRRRRTVSAAWRGGAAVISIPGHFTRTQELLWVRRMLEKLEARPAGSGGAGSDAALLQRARELSGRYLAGRAEPASIRWVSNQNGRWGSATPARGTIRISDKIEGMPAWVVDYVILHELAHLLESGHGPAFWQLLSGYPHLERAKAFLAGAAYAMGRGLGDDPVDGGGEPGQSPDGRP